MTYYIFNLPVFKQTFFSKFYYYIRKGYGPREHTTQIPGSPGIWVSTQNVHLKFNPWWITGFINAELSLIVFIIENKKLKQGLVVLIYFYIAFPKNILIRRSTIVVLPNEFWGSTEAPQLPSQNSVLPSRIARNYFTLQTERPSVDNFQRDHLFVTAFSVWGKTP